MATISLAFEMRLATKAKHHKIWNNFEHIVVYLGGHLVWQEHKWILTNATVSKDSDFGFIMVVYEKIVYLKETKNMYEKLI